MLGGGLGMLLVWPVPIALVIWLASTRVRRPGEPPAEKTALDILKKRYAQGEIGQEEFEHKKRDIGG